MINISFLTKGDVYAFVDVASVVQIVVTAASDEYSYQNKEKILDAAAGCHNEGDAQGKIYPNLWNALLCIIERQIVQNSGVTPLLLLIIRIKVNGL